MSGSKKFGMLGKDVNSLASWQSPCFSLLSAGITSVSHAAWFQINHFLFHSFALHGAKEQA